MEYFKMETAPKIFLVDWMICGVFEWTLNRWHVNGELGFDTRWKMDLKAKRIISKTNILSLIVYIDYLLYLDLRSNPNGIYKW